jgi:L-ascorbate metabolism protein UlaG (beta-lactamase superfamily)
MTSAMNRLLAAALTLAVAGPLSAQAPQVTIRWYGQSFFQLTSSKGTRVAFDPNAIEAYGRPMAPADLVLVSHNHDDHNQLDSIENRAQARVILGLTPPDPAKRQREKWNTVDEQFRDVKVYSVPSYHDNEGGFRRGLNTIFVVEVDGLRIVHLGDLGHELSEAQAKRIGDVDVLMIPAGGVYTMNGTEAKAVIAKLKPRLYVLPMHYGTKVYDDLLPPDEFLDGLKLKVSRHLSTNELVVPADLKKPEGPEVVLLGWRKGGV